MLNEECIVANKSSDMTSINETVNNLDVLDPTFDQLAQKQ
jgi:hypothetical protein